MWIETERLSAGLHLGFAAMVGVWECGDLSPLFLPPIDRREMIMGGNEWSPRPDGGESPRSETGEHEVRTWDSSAITTTLLRSARRDLAARRSRLRFHLDARTPRFVQAHVQIHDQ